MKFFRPVYIVIGVTLFTIACVFNSDIELINVFSGTALIFSVISIVYAVLYSRTEIDAVKYHVNQLLFFGITILLIGLFYLWNIF